MGDEQHRWTRAEPSCTVSKKVAKSTTSHRSNFGVIYYPNLMGVNWGVSYDRSTKKLQTSQQINQALAESLVFLSRLMPTCPNHSWNGTFQATTSPMSALLTYSWPQTDMTWARFRSCVTQKHDGHRDSQLFISLGTDSSQAEYITLSFNHHMILVYIYTDIYSISIIISSSSSSSRSSSSGGSGSSSSSCHYYSCCYFGNFDAPVCHLGALGAATRPPTRERWRWPSRDKRTYGRKRGIPERIHGI